MYISALRNWAKFRLYCTYSCLENLKSSAMSSKGSPFVSGIRKYTKGRIMQHMEA
jgi:hypothetical protein